MKLKQSVNLLLIALFLWAFQTTTIHFQHTHIDDISECNVCQASQQTELYHHNTPKVAVTENLAIKKAERVVRKVIVASTFVYTSVPHRSLVALLESQECSVVLLPLGYDATAPPRFS